MAEPLRHRQTKEAETDMFYLTPPRHISTLPDFGADGRTIANRGATRTLYSLYLSQVRHWIDSQGGLTPRMIFLRGRQLEAMYRPCYLNSQVAASR